MSNLISINVMSKNSLKAECLFFYYYCNCMHTVKMNMLYLINKIVATDYKQYYLLN